MTKFVFDLDGTITKVETLPLIASELGLADEMKLLTDLTLSGQIPFDKSFKLRYLVLRNVPLKKIRDIMSTVELDEEISAFVAEHKKNCAVVTGNLDCWIAPIVDKLGCESFSSTSELDANNSPVLKKILDKGAAIRELKKTCDKIVAVGESFNDVSMFEAADVSIAFGGVHMPVDAAISVADYVVFDSGALCRLLKILQTRFDS
ncbi:MAG: HAD family phosphatase [Selenomonadaceae bacterium]|nr:HAD family phosphatase [Selenomonadaceae bacterium]